MIRCIAVRYRSSVMYVPSAELTVVDRGNAAESPPVPCALAARATARGRGDPGAGREGGLESTVWAGHTNPLSAGCAVANSLQGTPPRTCGIADRARHRRVSYALDLGLPIPSDSIFHKDPEIKSEAIFNGLRLRPAARSSSAGADGPPPGTDGSCDVMLRAMPSFDSMPHRARRPRSRYGGSRRPGELRSWRLRPIRTDAGSPDHQTAAPGRRLSRPTGGTWPRDRDDRRDR